MAKAIRGCSGRIRYRTLGRMDRFAERGEAYRRANPETTRGAIEKTLEVVKYMNDHPEGWHHDMGSIAFVALVGPCTK